MISYCLNLNCQFYNCRKFVQFLILFTICDNKTPTTIEPQLVLLFPMKVPAIEVIWNQAISGDLPDQQQFSYPKLLSWNLIDFTCATLCAHNVCKITAATHIDTRIELLKLEPTSIFSH